MPSTAWGKPDIFQPVSTSQPAKFKETAHIECPPTKYTRKDYSQWDSIQVHQVRWNPKHDLLTVWCTNTPDIYIYYASSYKLKYTLVDPKWHVNEGISELSWSPDGTFLVKATQYDIDLWKISESSMDYVKNVERVSQYPSVAWSPSSLYLADADGIDIYGFNAPRVVNIYEMSSGKIVNTFKSIRKTIKYLLWSRDGKKLIVTGLENEVQIWDAETYTLTNTVSIRSGGIIIHGSGDDVIGSICSATERLCKLWLLDTKSLKWDIFFKEIYDFDYFDIYEAYQTSSDGRLLACDGGPKTVYIFNVSTGKLYDQLDLKADFLTSVAWSPDSAKLATGDTDGVVRIWTERIQ